MKYKRKRVEVNRKIEDMETRLRNLQLEYNKIKTIQDMGSERWKKKIKQIKKQVKEQNKRKDK